MIFVTEFEPRVSFINARARSNQTTLPLMMMMMMGVGTVATDRVIVRPTNCPNVRPTNSPNVRMSDRPTVRMSECPTDRPSAPAVRKLRRSAARCDALEVQRSATHLKFSAVRFSSPQRT